MRESDVVGGVIMKEKLCLNTGHISVSHSLQENSPDMTLNSHCHDVYEILYVIKGNGKFIVEGAEYDVKPRTLILLRSFAYHNLLVDKDAVFESFAINFNEKAFSQEVVSIFDGIMGVDDNGSYFEPSTVSEDIISVFDRFDIASNLPDNEQRAFVKMLLSELIILLSACTCKKMVQSEDELGAKVLRYLNTNIDKNLSLDRLAKRFFVSKYYLCRAFKKYNGISIHGYIVQKRIVLAKQLIELGETASGAAYKVGFRDYSAFYRAFVRIVGKSPTQD